MLTLAGCAAPQATTQPTTTVVASAPTVTGPADAKPTGPQLFELKIFQLAVPEGSISRNAEFWKPFDETFLADLWKHDVLYKNGIRVGRAPLSELSAIRGELDDAETERSQLIGTNAQNVEIPLQQAVSHEIIFWFDGAGRSEGRDFFAVDNLFMLDFRQVPRRPDHVRLNLTPAVRDQKQKLSLGEDGRPKWKAATSIYEVGITTELGVDECIVIAPSDVAVSTSTSVGRVFMMEDRPAARVEKVIVIVPRLVGNIAEVKPTARK